MFETTSVTKQMTPHVCNSTRGHAAVTLEPPVLLPYSSVRILIDSVLQREHRRARARSCWCAELELRVTCGVCYQEEEGERADTSRREGIGDHRSKPRLYGAGCDHFGDRHSARQRTAGREKIT